MTLEEYDALAAGARYNVLVYVQMTDPGPGLRALRRYRDGHFTLSDGEHQVLATALDRVPAEVTQ